MKVCQRADESKKKMLFGKRVLLLLLLLGWLVVGESRLVYLIS